MSNYLWESLSIYRQNIYATILLKLNWHCHLNETFGRHCSSNNNRLSDKTKLGNTCQTETILQYTHKWASNKWRLGSGEVYREWLFFVWGWTNISINPYLFKGSRKIAGNYLDSIRVLCVFQQPPSNTYVPSSPTKYTFVINPNNKSKLVSYIAGHLKHESRTSTTTLMKRGMTIKSSVEPMVVTVDACNKKFILCQILHLKWVGCNGLEGVIIFCLRMDKHFNKSLPLQR